MKKCMIAVLSALAGAVVGITGTGKICITNTNKVQNMSEKYLELFLLMNQWVKIKQEGKSIANYLIYKKYKTISIYGISYAGETLLDELKNTNIKIAYAIDQNADNICSEVKILSPNDKLPAVDAIIVTPVYFFDSIKEKLEARTNADILSLEDIIYDI